jgi:hypothetical protein
MTSAAQFLRLPYSRDLTEGGIAYALHSLSHVHLRPGDLLYERLRRTVASAAVELAFRRHLVEQNIPFEIKGAAPFTEPDRYDVTLGGRRCELKTTLISGRQQISLIQRQPQTLLQASALVASDQHAGAAHSAHDLYIFAFVLGQAATSPADLQNAIKANEPQFAVHVMPERWSRPPGWNPLGKLVAKSEAEESVTVEVGGQNIGREMQSQRVELPPGKRVEIQTGLFSLAYLHIKTLPQARLGIHSPLLRETHLVGATEWNNLWLDGTDIFLAGYMTHEEFSRHARFVPAGVQVFPYSHTHVKHLGVSVSDLRPLSGLFESVKTWSP